MKGSERVSGDEGEERNLCVAKLCLRYAWLLKKMGKGDKNSTAVSASES